jgi:hypothetical protein
MKYASYSDTIAVGAAVNQSDDIVRGAVGKHDERKHDVHGPYYSSTDSYCPRRLEIVFAVKYNCYQGRAHPRKAACSNFAANEGNWSRIARGFDFAEADDVDSG